MYIFWKTASQTFPLFRRFHWNRFTLHFHSTTFPEGSVVVVVILYSEVYSIQHFVIKFVSDFRQVSGFLEVAQGSMVPRYLMFNVCVM